MGAPSFPDDHQQSDPFAGFEPAVTPKATAPQRLRQVALPLLGLLVLGGWWVGQLFEAYVPEAEPLQASKSLLFIKAVADNGYPIAGAHVSLGGKKVGWTDAFGEWRRFVPISSADGYTVALHKTTPNGKLEAKRHIKQPEPPADGSVPTVKVRLKLKSSAELRRIDSLKARLEDPKAKLKGDDDYHPELFSRLALNIAPPGKLPDDISSKAYETLKTSSIAAIKKHSEGLGLTIGPSDDLALTIGYVPRPGRSGLIKGDLTYRSAGKTRRTSFLTHFGHANRTTADNIFKHLRWNLPFAYRAIEEAGRWYLLPPPSANGLYRLSGGEILADAAVNFLIQRDLRTSRFEVMTSDHTPCQGLRKNCILHRHALSKSPPYLRWERRYLKFQSPLPTGFSVFVAGLEAQPINESRQRFAYWAQPEGSHNLSVIEGFKLIHRAKVKTKPGGDQRIAWPPKPIANLQGPALLLSAHH